MKFSTALIFVTASAACVSAYAGTQDILGANNQVSVQAISTDVDYMEYSDNNAQLDSEKGHVPGVAVQLSLMRNWLFGNDYLQLQYSRASGNTNYTGSSLFGGGSYGSLVGQSGATLTDYSVRWGKGIALSQQVMLTPYVEVGHHEWQRGVNEGETYTNNYIGIGALAQFSPVQRLVLTASLLSGQNYGSHIDVAGQSTGFSGALGDSSMYKVGVAADYAFTPHLHGNIGIDYRSFDYGRSANYLTNSGGYYYEPRSETRYTTVSAGVGYSF